MTRVPFHILLFFLLFILLLSAKKSSNKCFNYPLTETEASVLRDVKARIERKETISKEYILIYNKSIPTLLISLYFIRCLFALTSRGHFEAATELYKSVFLLKNSPETKLMQSDLKNHLTNMRKDLDNLVNVLVSSNPKEIPTTTPVFQWVQSMDHILLLVKFAHRIDSPSCVNIKSEIINFSNDSMSLEALCITGHRPLKYQLNLNFSKEINIEKSHWNKEIGIIQFNISKNETGTLWRNLLSDNTKVPIWFEMKKFVARDMEDYFRMLDDEQKEKEKEEEVKIIDY